MTVVHNHRMCMCLTALFSVLSFKFHPSTSTHVQNGSGNDDSVARHSAAGGGGAAGGGDSSDKAAKKKSIVSAST